MQMIEYRRFIRHSLCFPLSFKILKKGSQERTKTINVSLGGLLFPAKQAVDAGSRILINMPFENKVFNIRAQVVRCTKSAKLYEVAVSFSSPQEAFKAKMIEQIYLIAEYRDLLTLQQGK